MSTAEPRPVPETGPPSARELTDGEMHKFLRGTIHDLRAGLRWMNTSLEMLEGNLADRVDLETAQLMERMRDAVVRMSAVITGISSFSIATSSSHYSFRTVPLELAVQTAMSGLRESITHNAAAFEIGELPAVHGDLSRLAELFHQLFSNSLKFRSAEPPCVSVRARILPSGNDTEITLEDNGIGIEERYLAALGTPFHRLHGPEIAGAGLGLFISKRIVAMHSGRLWILPRDAGRGTKVQFTLPLSGGPEVPLDSADV